MEGVRWALGNATRAEAPPAAACRASVHPRRRSSQLQPAAERALPICRRRDLLVEPLQLRGQRRWHLKDPLTLRYWQFGEEELHLWQQLDGTIGLAEWQARFNQRFAPRRIELAELYAFLGMLHREGLVVADTVGQDHVLLQRRAEQRRREWFGKLSNPLAIRFRGVDPEPFLTWLYPAAKWLFHPFAFACGLLFLCSAGLQLAVHWNQFMMRLSQAPQYLAAGNISWLFAALAVAKLLHELGHALACKHFGGECRELGFMLLVFTPCLYCNVSDMWLVPDKWRRMAVSTAGMYVELLLAALATWLWWFSVPGPVQSLCLAIMVVCSVSTLLFNGNPLLRYDGYFIVSDWLEMPNLRPEADQELRRTMARIVGIEVDQLDAASKPIVRAWLLAFAVASATYRIFVTGLILWFLHGWLSSRHLEYFSLAVLGLVATCMALPALERLRHWLSTPRRRRWHLPRLGAATTLAVASLATIFSIPWPYSVEAPATLRPAAATAVYVTVAGQLLQATPPGTAVQPGDLLAQLRNDDLELEIVRLTGECAVWERQRASLSRQRIQDERRGLASTASQLKLVEQSLLDAQQQLEQRRFEQEQLTVRASCSGTVLAPPPRPPAMRPQELECWGGSPLDPQNTGCFLETGTLLAYVGPPHRREALLLVDQSQMPKLQIGQPVRVQLDELPGRFLDGRVASVGGEQTVEMPPEFVAKQRLPVREPGGSGQILGTYFPVRVELQGELPIACGASGRARIRVARETLAQRLYDSVCRLFRFPPV